MAGRGRGGRWGGRGKPDQSVSVQAGNELAPITSQPPLLFPPLSKKPHPLVPSVEVDYQLLMKQIFIGRMQLSPSYLKMPLDKNKEKPVQEIDKLVAQLPSAKEKYDWGLFPQELRPKMVAARRIKKIKVENIDKFDLGKLEELEKIDAALDGDGNVKEEVEEEPEEVIEEEDEEMDDGTDYAHNYFENGEDYEDDDEDESAFS